MNKVNVYKDKLVLPTYELLEDDLNPAFDRASYPYTMQINRSYEVHDMVYDVVIIENEHIKVTTIPSLGGKIYSAHYKNKGKEIFTKNPVILPRMIARRGAWISGGVEFNFPISHSPNTMDRVNYTLKNYNDGSASIEFGNIEQMSSMCWKVELKLSPGKAAIEQNVKLYNPTSYENRFYFWTNAAVEYTANMRLIYPFDWCINNKCPEYIKWPYYKGVNASNPTEIPNSYETFGKLLTENFFGTYDTELDWGIVHYADRKRIKGAKFFIWGNDGRSVAWNRALTNDGTKYIEIQSGPFETQSVFKFLKPHQEIKWTEYWYPVFDMGGFKYAEKNIAVNYEFTGEGIKFMLLAVEPLKNSTIVFNYSGKEYKKVLDLIPGSVEEIAFDIGKPINMNDSFTLDIFSDSRYMLSLGSRDEFYENEIDIDLYEDSRVVYDKNEEKLFKQAVKLESMGSLTKACELFELILSKKPECISALIRLGGIYMKMGLIEKAQICYKKVLEYDNRNSKARFFYAVANKEKGDLIEARRLFMDIPVDSHYFVPSVLELAKINIGFGYYKDTLELLDSNISPENSYALFLTVICLRKAGLYKKSEEILGRLDWVDEYMLAEKFFLQCNSDYKNELLIYTGEDVRVLKSIIIEYMDMQLFDEALKIMGIIKKPDIKCKLLELEIKKRKGINTESLFNEIVDMPVDYAFVNEKLVAKVLSEYRRRDATGKLDYLLGNYFYWAGRKDEALGCFMDSYNKGFKYTALLRNLGYILYNYNKNAVGALKYFEEDTFTNGSGNESSITYLDRIYREKGWLDKRIQLIPYMQQAKNRSLILVSLISILKDAGREDEALYMFSTDQFENWEGREISGPLYRDVVISKAMKEARVGNIDGALKSINEVFNYPENINYGDSARAALAEAHYYKGLINSLAGNENVAVAEFKKGVLEGENDQVNDKAKNREFSIKCIGELQKRGCF